MTDEELSKLEAVARKAQEEVASPWYRESGSIGSVVLGKAPPEDLDRDDLCVADCWSELMSDHIAAFSPDVVLRLIAELRDLRELKKSHEEYRL
jgi:hypothetical protein